MKSSTWGRGDEEMRRWGDEGFRGLLSSSPPVKTWLFWPQLSYRLSAKPLMPSNGTRGSWNFTIWFCLHLLRAQLYISACDRLHTRSRFPSSVALSLCTLLSPSLMFLFHSLPLSYVCWSSLLTVPTSFSLSLLLSHLALIPVVGVSVSVLICFPIPPSPSPLTV